MGNLLAVEAMRQAKLEGTFTKLGKLHNVILASPDIDVDLFRRQLSVFSPDERRFYVFISRGDTALRASRFIGGGVPRVGAGDVKALTELGVTVIDLSEISSSGSSHSKFARSPEIVQLIGTRLSIDGPLQDSAQTPGLLRSILELPITVAKGLAAGQ